jgi:serine phosphatase RsbU (regulator of sigma subunit)
MLEYAIRLTGAERGFVFLGATADTFQFECGQDRSGAPIFEPTSISRSILHDAAGSRLAFLFSDAAEDTFPGSVQNPAQNPAQTRESLILAAIRNVVAIPLRSQSSSALLGLLYLDSRAATHDFTRTRRDILESIASQAATLFENLRMLDAEREFAVLRKELEIAASIQRQIIPQSLPEFPGVRLSARSIPCAEVGGDFYDVIPLPQGFAAIVGDVCGKGVPAALLASMVQGMFHAQMTTGASLLDAIRSLNTFVCQRAPIEKYVTLAVVLYSKSPTGRARLEVVNGGHVPPVIVRANGQVEAITDGDPPVGLLSFASFHSIPVDLAPGDRILLLSDGITEAENLAGIQFGPEQLEQFVAGANPVESIFAALDQFCAGTHPQDDQTILTIDCTA